MNDGNHFHLFLFRVVPGFMGKSRIKGFDKRIHRYIMIHRWSLVLVIAVSRQNNP